MMARFLQCLPGLLLGSLGVSSGLFFGREGHHSLNAFFQLAFSLLLGSISRLYLLFCHFLRRVGRLLDGSRLPLLLVGSLT
ncbi:hypothetical protein EV424DRAFT_1376263 [Suillus variegatus]|nr:hypothetical protein EV424DRAFT_1376263 [Suillus variegatus]